MTVKGLQVSNAIHTTYIQADMLECRDAIASKNLSHIAQELKTDEYETIFISACMLFKVCFSPTYTYLCLCNLKWTFLIMSWVDKILYLNF